MSKRVKEWEYIRESEQRLSEKIPGGAHRPDGERERGEKASARARNPMKWETRNSMRILWPILGVHVSNPVIVNIDSSFMPDWICHILEEGEQGHHNDLLLLLITICWSIYTQRNRILFQQGQGDIMECLNRAYRVIDELRSSAYLQRQDPFFEIATPRRSTRRTSLNATSASIHSNFTSHWNFFPRIGRKVFGIFRHQVDNLQPLCYLITEQDQDARLALLRTIRLFLETYGTENMGPIAFDVPDHHTIHHIYNIPKANTRY
ncbi:uncharacterized protein G2W53_007312 [Senna tora]|uniref:Uncharacterized protein n=1 Tax=Senna tora TaxID=362788 RepID=A0A835CFJ8_9FABA|nr:uncharacterized protein G2W53_007312 [Senna tora]